MTTDILVVDDSAAEQLYISHILRKNVELTIRFASDGLEALRFVAACKPSLIISDLHMPGMSGLELVRQLKRDNHAVPVVLITSCGSEEIAVKALRAGAASYVPKRIMDIDLVKTVRRVLALTAHRQNRRRHLENLTMLESFSVLENQDASISSFVSFSLEQAVCMRLLRGQEVTQVGIALQELLGAAMYQGNLGLDLRMRQTDEPHFLELAEQRRQQSPYADRRVHAEIKFDRVALRFIVKHQGEGIDLFESEDEIANVNMDRVQGRSLTLIRNFMDAVNYQPGLRQATMIKYVTDSRRFSPAMSIADSGNEMDVDGDHGGSTGTGMMLSCGNSCVKSVSHCETVV